MTRRPVAALAIAGCPLFPATNAWNQPVDHLPVHPKSKAMVRSVGAGAWVHPAFGSGQWEGGPIGTPVNVVPRGHPGTRPRFHYAAHSDPGPYPLPRRPRVQHGADRHLIVVERGSCKLYELFDARRGRAGWRAGSGAIWDLRSNRLRPAGWTSADAAGLPMLPGLARFEEARTGAIRHALRFTAPRTRAAFVFPARHFSSVLRDGKLPAMGQRVRLKRSVDASSFPPQARVIVRTLQRYGMILADHGGPWNIGGSPSAGWDDLDLRALRRLRGRDFEFVDTRSLPFHGPAALG